MRFDVCPNRRTERANNRHGVNLLLATVPGRSVNELSCSLLVASSVRCLGDCALVVGLAIGISRAKFLFTKNCRKNLERIDALEERKVWLFFRPWFFFFLFLMITFGATLSRLAHGHYLFLLGVSVLDFSVGGGLMVSSYVFWKERAFSKS